MANLDYLSPRPVSAQLRSLKLLNQSCQCNLWSLELTLPDNQDSPSCASKLLLGPPVSLDIPPKLLRPEIGTGLGQHGKSASFVVVPEAAMNENTGSEAWKHNIRTPRKILAMQPEAIAPGMQKLPNRHFRPGIPAPDTGHHSGSRRTVDDIHSYLLSTA